MKAIVFHAHGAPGVLRYEDVDTPHPGPGGALIKVGATTLNRGLDLQTRAGSFGGPTIGLPHIGGSDPAGEVVELGAGVEGVAVGDRVLAYTPLYCGRCDLCRSGVGENYCRELQIFGVHCWGGHAEYTVVPAQNLVRLRAGLELDAAATLSVSYITAWHGLVTRAGVSPEDTVLVMAAGSGIGTAAIQICRLRGARVLATTGTGWKASRARDLGADAVFDYHDPDWPQQVLAATGGRGASVLFDNIGGRVWDQSLQCLGRGGRLVCSGATADHLVSLDLRRLYRNQVSLLFNAQGTKAELALLAELVARGELDPVIDSRYPLREAPAAHARLESGEQFGKVVLQPT